MKLYSVLALCILTICVQVKAFHPTNFAVLDKYGEVKLRWSYSSKVIKMEITAPTTGWIGVGFSPSGTMKGADIIFAWMKNGVPHVLDMHSSDNGLPMLDKKQNLRNYSIKQNGTQTTLFINRFLDTCDKHHDFAITEDTTRLIFAYGDTIPNGNVPTYENYHGANRGVKSLRLLDKKIPMLDMKEKGLKYHDVRIQPFKIPHGETYYHCTYHKLPEFNDKQHMVQFEALLTPGNEKNVHHITMYHCNESLVTDEMLNLQEECYVNDVLGHWHYCSPVVAAWAVGMTEITLPKHVGFPLGTSGSPKIVKLEIHYDNKAREKDIIDSSGIRIYHTTNLRKYDAGILLTGHDVWPSLFVPPGSKDFVVHGHCSSQCLGQILKIGGVSKVNVFGAFLHSHTAGHKMILRHYRNGTELQPLAKDLAYDFDFQETKIFSKEQTVRSGDNLLMECSYDTRKRYLPTIGGLGTSDEMCFGFLMYYPKLEDAYCQSSPNMAGMLKYFGATSFRQAYYGAKAKNWTEKDRQTFNNIQLSAPFLELCRTMSGPIKGLQQPKEVPRVKDRFVEKRGRCELIKKENKEYTATHGLTKRSELLGDENENTESLQQSVNGYNGSIFMIVGLATIFTVVAITIVGLLYHKSE